MDHRIAIVGAPLSASISPGRCDLAPAAFRAALWRYSTFDLDRLHDVSAIGAIDLGDINLTGLGAVEAFVPIQSGVSAAVKAAEIAIVLGGDNGITRPGVHALGLPLKSVGLLTLDAHFDLRGTGDGMHNGNPIRALLEDGMPGSNMVQIGLQSFANSMSYAQIAREQGISTLSVNAARSLGFSQAVATEIRALAQRVSAIYVDIDLDVVDRAFVPATPGSRPGGVLPHELREAVWICATEPKVKAFDLVEMDPEQDLADSTSLLGAACILEIASGMMSR